MGQAPVLKIFVAFQGIETPWGKWQDASAGDRHLLEEPSALWHESFRSH